MEPFEYFEPLAIGEATQILANYGEKAQILAGGIDLIPRMQKGIIRAEYVVNIQKIPELDFIETNEKGGITFGAMRRLHSIELSKAIQSGYPILYEAVHQITSVQARYMGTAVGNLCVATPASDVATVLYALGAQLKIAGPKGERIESIEKFYVAFRKMSLERGEMVTQVILPGPTPATGTAFLNLVRTHADIAKVNTAVALSVQDGICREVRIAIGSVAPTTIRAVRAEAVLTGQKVTPEAMDEAAVTAAGETSPITDLRSTDTYRREMARVLVRRALDKALERATV
jgi:aerobic carbon-monoxide dehydrogenase medium subunit